MSKFLLMSIVIVPVLLGLNAAKGRNATRARSALRVGWVGYAVLWFAALYYLQYHR